MHLFVPVFLEGFRTEPDTGYKLILDYVFSKPAEVLFCLDRYSVCPSLLHAGVIGRSHHT